MTLQNRKPLNRMSEKKLASLGGRAFSTLAPGKPTKKKARSASERERIYGSDDYAEWLIEQPCMLAGHHDTKGRRHTCFGAIQKCHVLKDPDKGTSRKGGWRSQGPMCLAAHRLEHTIGTKSIQVVYTVDFAAHIDGLHAQYARERGEWQEARC